MWLAIDTATDRASVALGAPGGPVLEENLAGARRHASQLLPMIEALLRRSGATLDDVAGVVLSDGPGSFTGLRVGAAVAKGLVRTRGIPLWTAPSLLVRACGILDASAGDLGIERNRAGEAAVLAVTDALRGEVYAAAYRFTVDEIVVELAPSVWQPAALMQRLARPAALIGELPAALRALLEQWAEQSMIQPPAGAAHAARLIDLVGRAGGAVRVDDVTSWEPVYGRPAEAQVRWEMTHGRPLPNPAGSSS